MTPTEVPWSDGDWILLAFGMMQDGVMADGINLDTLSICRQMEAEGFLALTGMLGAIHVFHTTALGMAVIGQGVVN